MAIYNDNGLEKMLFTTGTFLINSNDAQNDESKLGKILLINLDNAENKIFAKGFRNPQGLFVKNNLILASSHGPKGGDEINKILYQKIMDGQLHHMEQNILIKKVIILNIKKITHIMVLKNQFFLLCHL